MDILVNNLKESNDFLNIIFENITSAIFLVNKEVKVCAFNNTFETIFNRKEDKIIGELCGNIIGCKYTVEENKNCGTTTNCNTCIIRKSIEQTFENKKGVFKQKLNRVFYIFNKPIEKYFEFSTKYIKYNNEEMILIIINDITDMEKNKIELEKRNKIIEDFNIKIKKELSIARNVQKHMLPNAVPNYDNIKVSYLYSPLYAIGGDIYDFIKINENKLGIFLGDVPGHGVSAAMLTTVIKSIMEDGSKYYNDVESFVSYLNNKVTKSSYDIYLPAFYGIIDTKTNNFTYCTCGHTYPILIREGNVIEVEEGSNIFLGMFENMDFTMHTLKLQKGDKLILYTDGLTESKNQENIYFKNSFLDYLKENSNLDISNLIKFIFNQVKNYVHNKNLEDDLTIIGFEILADN